MSALQILAELSERKVHVERRPGGKLYLEPVRALDPPLIAKVRAHKAELLALLSVPAVSDAEENEVDRLAQADNWKSPKEIPPGIAAEIQRIEPDALRLGWSKARLWNFQFWPDTKAEPRGLASVMNQEDSIISLSKDYIGIGSTVRHHADYRRFWRYDG